MRKLREAGAVVAIVSITWLFAVEWFAARLGVAHCADTKMFDNGRIERSVAPNKPTWVSGGVTARWTYAGGTE